MLSPEVMESIIDQLNSDIMDATINGDKILVIELGQIASALTGDSGYPVSFDPVAGILTLGDPGPSALQDTQAAKDKHVK